MNKKIIVLVSFLSVSGISWFSWRIIQKDNSRYLINREDRDKNSQKIIQNNLRKIKSSLSWLVAGIIVLIIVGIIILVAISIMIYLILITKENTEKDEIIKKKSNPDTIATKNEFQKILDKIEKIHRFTKNQDKKIKTLDNVNSVKKPIDIDIENYNTYKKNNDHKYDDWVCGIIVENNTLSLTLCKKYDLEAVINKIWLMDIDSNNDIQNKKMKKLYDAVKINENKEKFCNFIRDCLNLLKYITVPFLTKIKEMESGLSSLSEDSSTDCKKLLEIANEFFRNIDVKNKENQDEEIILKNVNTASYTKDAANIEGEGLETNFQEFNNVDNKNVLDFASQIIPRSKTVYYNYSRKIFWDKIRYLFEYSSEFYRLIHEIKLGFIHFLNFLVKNDKEEKIMPIAKRKEIQDCLNKIQDFLKRKRIAIIS